MTDHSGRRRGVMAGIFVGGASRRMGRPKGLLQAPGSQQNLVQRLSVELKKADPSLCPVLVGQHEAYAHLGLPLVQDEQAGRGPLGGILGLFREAIQQGMSHCLVLACDLPYLQAPLISRLLNEKPEAEIVCARVDDRYQPLAARYCVELREVFLQAFHQDRLALQPLLGAAKTEVIELSEAEEASLQDWDTPEDAGL